MSRASESDDGGAKSVLELFEDWYHVPSLLLIAGFMLVVRLQTYSNFVNEGAVVFSGNDAWYHLREVNYAVRNYPFTMPFDPWTYFPYGTSVGQFGTLYDQLIATAALLVGLGTPSDALIAKTLLVTPAVFGALAAIPTFLIGRRIAGRLPALFGALLLALLPGVFLRRTLVGFADHNGAEPFFQAMAVVVLVGAFVVAEREMPIWELVVDRDYEALRTPTLWAVAAGVATALYMWVWPPGILLVGIVAAFLVLKLSSDVVNDRSPEPVAFAGAVSMAVTGVLMLLHLQEVSFSPTQFSLVQPLLAFGVAGGSVFMAWLARVWERRDLPMWAYPASVFGIILVGVGLLAVLLPGFFNTIQANLLRTVGFSAGAETRTIGEAQPYLSPNVLQQQALTPANRIISDYGFTLFTGIVGAVWMLARPIVRKERTRHLGFVLGGLAAVGLLFLIPAIPAGIGAAIGIDSALVSLVIAALLLAGAALLVRHDADRLFVIVWAAFITAAAFTQVRFNYYLAIPVAVMNAFLFGELLRYFGLTSLPSSLDDIEGYQVMAVAAALLLITAPVLVVPLNVRSTGNPQFDSSQTAWQAASSNPVGSVNQWQGSLAWMQNQTPAEGTMGGATDEMEYYGTYQRTDDFEYDSGAYGVMSWWDYGHWITVLGERIPNANPFQQGAQSAANYLLAPNEEAANEVLAEQSTEGENTRYVMVDWQMATPGSKFGAPIVFYDESNVSRGDFYDAVYSSNLQQNFLYRQQRYYDSQMVRLYEYHGSAMEPAPIVLDWEIRQAQTQSGETIPVKTVPQGNESVIKSFDNMSAARDYVERDGSAQVGGIGPYPEERVPALKHYRLVRVSNATALDSASYQREYARVVQQTGVPYRSLTQTRHSWVKTFERVPGATVEGSGAPANTTVTASVRMQVPTDNSTFVYTQQATADENGEFTMTLPYATTGYDQYGPENGYTNVSVRAAGPYSIRTSPQVNDSGYLVRTSAELNVSEGLVNGAEDGAATVTLERSAQNLTGGDDENNETTGTNETTTGTNETVTNETADGGPTNATNVSSAVTPVSDATSDTTSIATDSQQVGLAALWPLLRVAPVVG